MMNENRYRKYTPTVIKQMSMDLLENSKTIHHIASFIELDITSYRTAIKAYRVKNNCGLSVFAFLIKGLSDTLAEFPCMQTFHYRSRKAVEFFDVDISFMVEKKYKEVMIPSTYIIRSANLKSLAEVHEEIEACISQKIDSQSPFANRKSPTVFNFYPYLPKFLRLLFLKEIGKHPFFIKKIGGTALVTSLANFGSTSAWIIPLASYPFILGIGTVTKKPWVVHDEIKIRQIQNLTFQFNHDFVDGSDAARFVVALVRRFEVLSDSLKSLEHA